MSRLKSVKPGDRISCVVQERIENCLIVSFECKNECGTAVTYRGALVDKDKPCVRRPVPSLFTRPKPVLTEEITAEFTKQFHSKHASGKNLRNRKKQNCLVLDDFTLSDTIGLGEQITVPTVEENILKESRKPCNKSGRKKVKINELFLERDTPSLTCQSVPDSSERQQRNEKAKSQQRNSVDDNIYKPVNFFGEKLLESCGVSETSDESGPEVENKSGKTTSKISKAFSKDIDKRDTKLLVGFIDNNNHGVKSLPSPIKRQRRSCKTTLSHNVPTQTEKLATTDTNAAVQTLPSPTKYTKRSQKTEEIDTYARGLLSPSKSHKRSRQTEKTDKQCLESLANETRPKRRKVARPLKYDAENYLIGNELTRARKDPKKADKSTGKKIKSPKKPTGSPSPKKQDKSKEACSSLTETLLGEEVPVQDRSKEDGHKEQNGNNAEMSLLCYEPPLDTLTHNEDDNNIAKQREVATKTRKQAEKILNGKISLLIPGGQILNPVNQSDQSVSFANHPSPDIGRTVSFVTQGHSVNFSTAKIENLTTTVPSFTFMQPFSGNITAVTCSKSPLLVDRPEVTTVNITGDVNKTRVQNEPRLIYLNPSFPVTWQKIPISPQKGNGAHRNEQSYLEKPQELIAEPPVDVKTSCTLQLNKPVMLNQKTSSEITAQNPSKCFEETSAVKVHIPLKKQQQCVDKSQELNTKSRECIKTSSTLGQNNLTTSNQNVNLKVTAHQSAAYLEKETDVVKKLRSLKSKSHKKADISKSKQRAGKAQEATENITNKKATLSLPKAPTLRQKMGSEVVQKQLAMSLEKDMGAVKKTLSFTSKPQEKVENGSDNAKYPSSMSIKAAKAVQRATVDKEGMKEIPKLAHQAIKKEPLPVENADVADQVELLAVCGNSECNVDKSGNVNQPEINVVKARENEPTKNLVLGKLNGVNDKENLEQEPFKTTTKNSRSLFDKGQIAKCLENFNKEEVREVKDCNERSHDLPSMLPLQTKIDPYAYSRISFQRLVHVAHREIVKNSQISSKMNVSCGASVAKKLEKTRVKDCDPPGRSCCAESDASLPGNSNGIEGVPAEIDGLKVAATKSKSQIPDENALKRQENTNNEGKVALDAGTRCKNFNSVYDLIDITKKPSHTSLKSIDDEDSPSINDSLKPQENRASSMSCTANTSNYDTTYEIPKSLNAQVNLLHSEVESMEGRHSESALISENEYEAGREATLLKQSDSRRKTRLGRRANSKLHSEPREVAGEEAKDVDEKSRHIAADVEEQKQTISSSKKGNDTNRHDTTRQDLALTVALKNIKVEDIQLPNTTPSNTAKVHGEIKNSCSTSRRKRKLPESLHSHLKQKPSQRGITRKALMQKVYVRNPSKKHRKNVFRSVNVCNLKPSYLAVSGICNMENALVAGETNDKVVQVKKEFLDVGADRTSNVVDSNRPMGRATKLVYASAKDDHLTTSNSDTLAIRYGAMHHEATKQHTNAQQLQREVQKKETRFTAARKSSTRTKNTSSKTPAGRAIKSEQSPELEKKCDYVNAEIDNQINTREPVVYPRVFVNRKQEQYCNSSTQHSVEFGGPGAYQDPLSNKRKGRFSTRRKTPSSKVAQNRANELVDKMLKLNRKIFESR